ncbi:MAG: alpha-2-macroglobulin [Sphingomonas bacterium]|uniref:alpha-2-macroglobulin family protein n=1 Tax=Sphingomonas bacterium TaxID=1895847 RepID=UPI0026358A64|nr:Ig-like domain-containing alpha-2-macroglobulin family protein [Sphingomonas bacterium]MDB5695733.1 alpha-2-macroglobulin [Sphingomonas bacterium]
MRRAWRMAVLALSLVPVAAFGDNSPRVAFAQPRIGNGAIERFTVRFSQAMVPLGDPRARAPLSTGCAGLGRWVDQQTWVFEFAAPLAGGAQCKFDAAAGTRSVAGYDLAGQTSFTVDAGGPVARAVLPGGDGESVEEDQTFLVAANMAPTRATVAAHAYCAVDGIGEKIPVELLAPDLPRTLIGAMGTDRYQVRSFLENGGMPSELPAAAADRKKMLSNVVALKCQRPLPPGRDVSLVWGAQIAGGGKVAGADQRFDYTVRKPFAARFECSRVNAAAGCSPVEKAYVRFSAPIAMSAARQIAIATADGVQIKPIFSKDEEKSATISDVAFAAPLPFGTAATLTLPADVKDESGRALTNASRFPLAVKFDQAPPLVKFAAGFGILEATQGGVLPVTVRNVEPALQGRNLAVPGRTLRVEGSDGKVAEWLRAVTKAGEDKVEDVMNGDEVVRRINHTGDTSILPAGEGTAMQVGLPGKGRDFEVVGIPLKQPGFYVVELASPQLGRALLGRDAPRYVAAAALVTNMAVHFKWGRERSLAWVTSLDTGKPVANAQVRITDSCTGAMLAQGVTDRSGGAFVRGGIPEPATYGYCEGDTHPLMVSARAGDDYSFTLTSWGNGIQPYDFDLPYGYSAPGETLHTVFDRALVRQGETINMKHLLRQQVGSGFRIPGALTGVLKLSHRGSDMIFEQPLRIANGVGETRWAVPAGAPMGDYDLSVDGVGTRSISVTQSFRVDEYKLPTMRATVTGPKEAAVRPRQLPLDLFVGYLSGGGAGNLPVDLRVGWFAHENAPEGYESYTFGGQPVVEGTRPLDGDGEDSASPLPPTQTLPLTLSGDGTGRQTVEVPALDRLADMRIEMDYQDANGETLTASRVVPIFPAAVQLGMKTDGWLMKQDDLRLRLVALDTAGKPLKGQRVEVAVYSRQVLTARRRLIGGFYSYDNQMKTAKLDASCAATTDAQGLASCDLDPGVSGEVYAVATATDADGNTTRSVRSVWLAGDDEWWFGGDNGDRMDVVPEQTSYKAGETARFQVRMPFRRATALVTVEREGVLSSFVTELSGTDPVVEVPMPGSYAPDVFVSVLAVRGRIEAGWFDWVRSLGETLGLMRKAEPAAAPTALVDLAKPAYRLGIAKVKVGWDARTLQVAVKADAERYGPRATANTTIEVRGPDGKPARSADVAFAAVDQALLQLMPNPSWDVLTAMMGERPLSVLTSTAQMQVVGKRHYGRKAVEAGGGGGADQAALNRENFQPVLLWRGRVALNANGQARVAVPLSDALSSFKLVAIATDGADRFGTGETSIRTAQDLQLFAGLPPLVREGDRFAAGFTLRNGSSRPMTVTATVDLQPRIAAGRPLTVTVPPNGAVPVAWNLTAPANLPQLRWQVSARSTDGKAADRLTVTQDVVPAVPVETWAAALARVGDTSMPIAPPAGFIPGRGSVDIHLSDTLAPPLTGVRAFMAAYPWNCLEQQLSRAVALGDTAAWNSLAGALPTYQASDGLLRFFPSATLAPSEALTAYVLTMTAEAGLPIPDATRTRMVEGLKAVIDGRVRQETYGDIRVRRLVAFNALARAGAATPAMMGQIGLTTREMPTAFLADYLLALDRLQLANAAALKADAQDQLRSRLVFEGTRLDLSDAANSYWWMMSSGDEAAAKLVLATLGRPGWQDDAGRMMLGLAMRQQKGRWDLTTANAWGALAVGKFARLYPATAVTGTTGLTLGGRTIERGWPLGEAQRAVSFPLPSAPTPLLLRQAGGTGPWATVSVKAAVPLTRPLFAGYRMGRQVTVVQRRHPDRWTRGDVMRVTLTVDASAERNWVALNDPIPAGASIVGDLGGQSRLLREGEDRPGESANVLIDGKPYVVQSGAQPAYVERARDSWRGFFAWVPAGRFVVSYTLRLNNPGRYSLPPSRVEAMYSPAVRAHVPNGAVEIGDR